MKVLPFKRSLCWIFLLGLLLVIAACTSTEPWWKAKPASQMTPAEIEEQDIEFWPMWKSMHEDRL
jgi:hypothetical protein